MSNLIVKPRTGNRSASLYRSRLDKSGRKTVKPPVSIGAVDAGADLVEGTGLRLKKGYRLADFSAEDLEKIAKWLATANDSPRVPGKKAVRQAPTSVSARLEELSAKMDLLLANRGLAASPGVNSLAQVADLPVDATPDERLNYFLDMVAAGLQGCAETVESAPGHDWSDDVVHKWQLSWLEGPALEKRVQKGRRLDRFANYSTAGSQQHIRSKKILTREHAIEYKKQEKQDGSSNE